MEAQIGEWQTHAEQLCTDPTLGEGIVRAAAKAHGLRVIGTH